MKCIIEWQWIMWFIFGLITATINAHYGLWGLITVPIWAIIGISIDNLLKWKPTQRSIEDFGE